MRPVALLVSLAALSLAVVAGCGDDGDVARVDARPSADAAAGADAPATDNTSTKLGKPCSGPADSGFCSLDCGTSTAPMTAPSGGNTLCAAQYDGSSGTPLCGANDATGTSCPSGTCTWLCVVACGDYMGQALGSCPNGLACSGNACN
jgi:hypothetical protein